MAEDRSARPPGTKLGRRAFLGGSAALGAAALAAAGGNSRVLICVSRVAMSLSSWSAKGLVPLVEPSFHRWYSSRCQPVNCGSAGPSKSSTRASTLPSISSTRPAMGSMRSQRTRLGAYCCLASATSPALTASVNSRVSATRASTSATTHAL